MFKRSNALRLIHASTVRGPAFGSPTTFGRLAGKPEMGGLFAWRATLAESDTVNGVPELCAAMTLTCQSDAIARTAAGPDPGDGRFQAALATSRCRASNSDGPHSASRSNGFCARSFS